MKKCVLGLCLILFTSFAFAQYGPYPGDYPPPPYGDYAPPPPPRGDHVPPPPPGAGAPRHNGYNDDKDSPAIYLSLNFPFPIQWENFSGDDNLKSTLTFGCAVGADLTALFTKRLGLHLSADIYFPQIQSVFYDGSDGSLYSEIYFMSDYWQESWGVSFFVGPTLALARTNRVLFAVSPGAHVAAFFGDTWGYSNSRFLAGLGANAELAFNVTSSMFIRAAVDITYDFAGIERYSNNGWYGPARTEFNNMSVLNIVPSIGVGYKF